MLLSFWKTVFLEKSFKVFLKKSLNSKYINNEDFLIKRASWQAFGKILSKQDNLMALKRIKKIYCLLNQFV